MVGRLFAAIIVGMTWVEFFYMYYGRKNFGMLPRLGEAVVGEHTPRNRLVPC